VQGRVCYLLGVRDATVTQCDGSRCKTLKYNENILIIIIRIKETSHRRDSDELRAGRPINLASIPGRGKRLLSFPPRPL
jgi:hypothetical protein